MPQVYLKLSYLCWKLFGISINCNHVKERCEALKKTLKKITFNFQVNNGEWFTWIQLSDQELRNSKFLKWRYTVNIANRLANIYIFCEVVWLVVPFPLHFRRTLTFMLWLNCWRITLVLFRRSRCGVMFWCLLSWCISTVNCYFVYDFNTLNAER